MGNMGRIFIIYSIWDILFRQTVKNEKLVNDKRLVQKATCFEPTSFFSPFLRARWFKHAGYSWSLSKIAIQLFTTY